MKHVLFFEGLFYIHVCLIGNVDVFAVNPSWTWTTIHSPMYNAFGLIPFIVCYPIFYMLKFILAKTPKAGAQTSIFCAVEPSLQRSHEFYFE